MSIWTPPIVFENAPEGISSTFTTTEAALDALNGDWWPSRSGMDYRAAKEACENAMAGRGCHVEARMMFVYAADEVGLFPRL